MDSVLLNMMRKRNTHFFSFFPPDDRTNEQLLSPPALRKIKRTQQKVTRNW